MGKYQIDFDFVAVPLALLRCGLDATAIAAYVGIRSLARYETQARVTDDEAAAAGGMSVRSFRDARSRLREAGWLAWTRTGRASEYLILTVPETSGKTEIRSAESADQGGSVGASDRQILPIASTDENKEELEEGPKAPPFDLSGYIDQHQKLIPGSVAPAGIMAPIFKALEKRAAELHPDAPLEQRRGTILHHQRRYLESLIAEGGLQYLSYPKFRDTFSQWASDKKRRRGGQPEDHRDGMDELGR